MTTKELTAEEQAFFDNGDTSGLPDDYAADVKLPAPDEGTGEPPAANDDTQAHAEQATAGDVEKGGHDGEENGDSTAEATDGKKTVPLATHLEERRKRQETEKALQQLQERQRIIDDRMAALAAAQAAREAQQAQERQQAQQAAQQANQPQIPDPELDPIGAAKWAVEQITAQQRQQQEYQNMTAQQRQQHEERQRYEHQVIQTARQVYQEHGAADPEFESQRQYLLRSHVNELMARGLTQEQAMAQVTHDEFQLVEDSFRRRANPAETIKRMAMARGYRKGWDAPEGPAEQQGATAAERLAKVEQGQQASVSPSIAGTSGVARSGKLDAKALAEMSDKEFKEFLAKDQDGDTWRKVMGA